MEAKKTQNAKAFMVCKCSLEVTKSAQNYPPYSDSKVAVYNSDQVTHMAKGIRSDRKLAGQLKACYHGF